MILHTIDFGPVWGASGVQGFFGEGYWYHRLPFGPRFDGMTLVAKTATLDPRAGNMPLDPQTLQPKERFPKCMKVYPRAGMALNAIGLSNPGIEELLARDCWQRLTQPFFLSVAPVGKTPEQRLCEIGDFCGLVRQEVFAAPFGLQLNVSCPNTGHDFRRLIGEARAMVTVASDRLSDRGVPIVPKFNVLVPPAAVAEIADMASVSAVAVSNTVPWGELPDRINWEQLFGTTVSPLVEYGGGGLSGAPLLPLLIEWLEKARHARFPKPINAGGGILSSANVRSLKEVGAAGISVGSVAFLRPWRMRSIIAQAHRLWRR